MHGRPRGALLGRDGRDRARLLVLIPLPFIRSMGVGGLLIPLVSITAALTLLPALLAIFGSSLLRMRVPLIGLRPEREGGIWARIAETIMRRPALVAGVTGGFLRALRAARAAALADAGIEQGPALAVAVGAGPRSCSSGRSARARSRRSSPWSTAGAPAASARPGPRSRGSSRRCAPIPRSRSSRRRPSPACRRTCRPTPPAATRASSSRPARLRHGPGQEARAAVPPRLRARAGFGARASMPAAGRRPASTSSTAPTAPSSGSCSACSRSPISCSCARSARCSCRSRP